MNNLETALWDFNCAVGAHLIAIGRKEDSYDSPYDFSAYLTKEFYSKLVDFFVARGTPGCLKAPITMIDSCPVVIVDKNDNGLDIYIG